jgi:hypothetical protein
MDKQCRNCMHFDEQGEAPGIGYCSDTEDYRYPFEGKDCPGFIGKTCDT